MKSSIGHLVYGVSGAHSAFYKALLQHLGWQVIMDAHGFLGFSDSSHASVWFVPKQKDHANDYDGIGLNHAAFAVGSQADVDATVKFLPSIGATPLFETPRHRPDFSMGEGNTYYQVMFESPDKLLFEVVYTGPKQG